METRRDILTAVRLLNAGQLVAFPTETVYGLGADAENPAAVRRIFLVKGRPASHPVIVHLADVSQLNGWADPLPPAALPLAQAFWPGPLTMILPRGSRALDAVTGGQPTVGIRIPRHAVAQELLREFGRGIAAPSANRFGRVSPTTAEHVREELGDAVSLILDGGPCEVGLESTIVDLSGSVPAILRPGAVTAEQISDVLGRAVGGPTNDAPRVPGALASHYAPQARVELVRADNLVSRLNELLGTASRIAVLTDGPLPSNPKIVRVDLAADPEEQARGLYAALRRADHAGCDVALVPLPDESGLGVAIADRLRRAAGPGGTGDRVS